MFVDDYSNSFYSYFRRGDGTKIIFDRGNFPKIFRKIEYFID